MYRYAFGFPHGPACQNSRAVAHLKHSIRTDWMFSLKLDRVASAVLRAAHDTSTASVGVGIIRWCDPGMAISGFIATII